MKVETIISERNIKILGYIIGLISIGLIGREIYHFFVLPSTDEIPETIDLFKYKETTIGQGYLWFLILLLGFGLIKRNVFGWIIPQTLLLIGLFPFIWIPVVYGVNDNDIGFLIIGILYLIFCFIIIRLFLIGKPKDFFRIALKKLKYHYLLLVVFVALYWIIDFLIY